LSELIDYCRRLVDSGFLGKPELSEADKLSVAHPVVYHRSLAPLDGAVFFLARVEGRKALVILGKPDFISRFKGDTVEVGDHAAKVMDRGPEAAVTLRRFFPFTKPVPVGERRTTFGTGDRLGEATPGHIRAFEGFVATPVLAQQSWRELEQTGRTYQQVMDDATWGVFQEGYRGGFGADGDHLKFPEQFAQAIDAGVTMITADVSDHLKLEVVDYDRETLARNYRELPAEVRSKYESSYLGKEFKVKGVDGGEYTVKFDQESLARAVLLYREALDYARRMYDDFVAGKGLDFEMSIDETPVPTEPEAHFFVANELWESGVKVTSLAPRFTGDFQKGIDYIGRVEDFTADFRVHAAIADHFGHKLSIHSGSDKFAIFPVIGRYTNFRFHHKTAGTSWLEAVKLAAMKDPALFREMLGFAVENYEEARKLYHITADPSRIPRPEDINDEDLVTVLQDDDGRQVMHIAYGLILRARDGDRLRFRDRFYSLLFAHEDEHYRLVASHIRRHLEALGIPRSDAVRA